MSATLTLLLVAQATGPAAEARAGVTVLRPVAIDFKAPAAARGEIAQTRRDDAGTVWIEFR